MGHGRRRAAAAVSKACSGRRAVCAVSAGMPDRGDATPRTSWPIRARGSPANACPPVASSQSMMPKAYTSDARDARPATGGGWQRVRGIGEPPARSHLPAMQFTRRSAGRRIGRQQSPGRMLRRAPSSSGAICVSVPACMSLTWVSVGAMVWLSPKSATWQRGGGGQEQAGPCGRPPGRLGGGPVALAKTRGVGRRRGRRRVWLVQTASEPQARQRTSCAG